MCSQHTWYSEIHVTAMGLPISSTIMSLYSTNTMLMMFYKYTHDKLDYTLQKLNLFHLRLKFTMEKEQNNTKYFLDILLLMITETLKQIGS